MSLRRVRRRTPLIVGICGTHTFTDADNAHGVALAAALGFLAMTCWPSETSVPGVFAVGDVRAGSMKRVAAAVGEGASAVRSVHQVMAAPSAKVNAQT